MKKRAYLYPIGLTAFLLLNSARPAPGPDLGGVVGVDKVLHFFFFGLLATTLIRTPHFQKTGRTFLAWVLVVGVGILDEALQSFSPYRTTDFFDLISDALGAGLAIGLYRHWPRYRNLLEYRPGPSKPSPSPATLSSSQVS